jgi:hypothetical protein
MVTGTDLPSTIVGSQRHCRTASSAAASSIGLLRNTRCHLGQDPAYVLNR